MKRILYLSLIFLLCLSCNLDQNRNRKIQEFVPSNASLIIRTKSLGNLSSDLSNNNLIKRISKAGFLDSLSKQLHKFDSLKIDNEVLICISKTNDISYITKQPRNFVLDSNINNLSANLNKTIVDSVIVVSTSKDIIEQLKVKRSNKQEAFFKLYDAFDKSPLSIFINQNAMVSTLDSLYQNSSYGFANLSDWMAFDADIQPEQILLNGVASVTDTLPKLLNVFKQTTAKSNRTADWTPQNVDGFISLTFDDFKVFRNNLNTYNLKKSDSTIHKLFNSTQEIGLIFKDQSLAIALHTVDIIETQDALLDEQNVVDTFRQVDIFNYSKTDFFSTTLEPLVTDSVDKYIILDDVVIFSNNEDFLKDIIASKQNKSVLSNMDAFQDIMENLSSESSLLMVANNTNFKLVWERHASSQFKKHIKALKLEGYDFSAIQFIQDFGFLHCNAIISKSQPKAIKNTITEQFSIVLDDPILNEPQIVKNHLTNQNEIVVQDIKNTLYLISNKGKILWRKQLKGPVLGSIEQIDMYKNGRLQLAFATPKRVYVLDRNGRDVSPFPLKFNDAITQPLSVFDYDQRKDYRLLVTQGKALLMFDDRGKRVKGFKFKGAQKTISSQPKHMRMGSKDYIVFAAGDQLNILNRTGNTRIDVKQTFDFSDNEIYLYQNKFSFSNQKGQLIQVNQNGQVGIQNLLLGSDHDLTTTSKTLVALSGNKLTIKSRTIDLDFGQYTQPKIFYLHDKIYVAVTDMQAQKVYLFDSQAKPVNNFPVYGTSTLQLDNMDRDQNLEFVVKGDRNNLIMYQIN